MKKILFIFAMMVGGASIANAGILIEPYLGYESTSIKPEISAPIIGSVSWTDTATGASYGMRLGYKFLIPWVALDYTGMSGKAKAGATGVSDYDVNQTGLGLVVGADLPLVRFWGGYGFSNELTQKGYGTPSTDFKYKGSYLKAGLGLGFIPFVSVNLEYKINDFKKLQSTGAEIDVKSIYSSYTSNSLMLSVSAPFNL